MKSESHTTKRNPAQCLKLVKEVSRRLSIALDNISWTNYYQNYLQENIKEEKSHLSVKPDGIQSGMTATDGGTFFSVLQIIEFLEDKRKKPEVESYIFCRKSIYTAYSLVAQYKDNILKELNSVGYKDILNMDYCFLASHDKKGNELY